MPDAPRVPLDPIYRARIAGLPAGSVESFGSDRLRQRFADRHLVETERHPGAKLAGRLRCTPRSDVQIRRIEDFSWPSGGTVSTAEAWLNIRPPGSFSGWNGRWGRRAAGSALLEERLELLDREVQPPMTSTTCTASVKRCSLT